MKIFDEIKNGFKEERENSNKLRIKYPSYYLLELAGTVIIMFLAITGIAYIFKL